MKEIEKMMRNFLKRKVNQVFGANNNVCIQTINDRMALSGMRTIKFSDLDNFKDIITNIEFDGINMFFDWNKKTLALASMFSEVEGTKDNVIDTYIFDTKGRVTKRKNEE